MLACVQSRKKRQQITFNNDTKLECILWKCFLCDKLERCCRYYHALQYNQADRRDTPNQFRVLYRYTVKRGNEYIVSRIERERTKYLFDSLCIQPWRYIVVWRWIRTLLYSATYSCSFRSTKSNEWMRAGIEIMHQYLYTSIFTHTTVMFKLAKHYAHSSLEADLH